MMMIPHQIPCFCMKIKNNFGWVFCFTSILRKRTMRICIRIAIRPFTFVVVVGKFISLFLISVGSGQVERHSLIYCIAYRTPSLMRYIELLFHAIQIRIRDILEFICYALNVGRSEFESLANCFSVNMTTVKFHLDAPFKLPCSSQTRHWCSTEAAGIFDTSFRANSARK